ncbi:MAG: cbb3-type cytochrome c oxidase subunit I, partial [Planctomycetales bacterium]|nr:cbb3-type cytochrome c oxidase subunit I [Planctomycetales bacterium]
ALTGWITTADHKRIGRLLIGSSLLFGAATFVLTALLGLERMDQNGSVLDAGSVGQLFALERVALPFMAAVPLLLGLAVAVVPLQLGARGLAFGRAAAFGFWTWLLGSALVVASFIGNGGPGGGDSKMVDLFLVSLGITLVGLLVIAGSVATTVLTSRAPGMTLQRVPGLAWASLVGSVALLVTVPVLIGDLVLLGVDHKYVRTPGFGANLDLLGWMSWGLSQPATIAYSLIALGVVADVVTTASHRRSALRPVFLVGVAVAATAVLGAVTQKVQLLEWNGDAGSKIQDLLPWALFHLLPILGPVLVLAVCGQALAAGKIAKVWKRVKVDGHDQQVLDALSELA